VRLVAQFYLARVVAAARRTVGMSVRCIQGIAGTADCIEPIDRAGGGRQNSSTTFSTVMDCRQRAGSAEDKAAPHRRLSTRESTVSKLI
jgi:hypothetical protein